MEKDNSNNLEKNVKIESINVEDNQTRNEIDYTNVNKSPNNSRTSNNNRVNIELQSDDCIDRDLREVNEKFEVPLHLKKTFICSLILFIIGGTLIGIGFIEDVATADPGKGITFWCLGGILLIPGGYYSYQFYKAKKTQDLQERDDILNEIPEL